MSTTSTTVIRVVTFVLLFGILALETSPAFAQFTQGGEAAKNWFIQLVTPFIAIGVCVLFVMCLTGKANWGWFGLAVLGIVGFYGHEQVISMVRGWFGA